jgi:hypothetical protein
MTYVKKVRVSPEKSTKAKNSVMNIGKIRDTDVHIHYGNIESQYDKKEKNPNVSAQL